MTATPEAAALKWHRRLPVQRRLRLLARLATMGPAELRLRLRRALSTDAARVRERVAAERRAADAGRQFLAALDAAGGARAALRTALDDRFLYGPDAAAALGRAIAAGRADAEETLALAERALAGTVTLLGVDMRLAPDTDWQADPLGGVRVWGDGAFDEAFAIAVTGADVKYVWELNRQQWLPLLGRAYRISGDPRYARYACALLDAWLAQNPYRRGVNWCSHLEVGMRAISWLWTLPLLLGSDALDDALLRRWSASLAEHYRHLADNLSIHTDPTNHLIGETTALWMLSACLPALPGAEAEARRCRALLLRELDAQVHDDGVNLEQASSYHRFVLDFYLQFLVLGDRHGAPLPGAARARVERMCGFAAALGGRGGRAPMIGDCDDARALPLLERVGWDFRDSVAVGALLFGRGDWAARATPPQAALWLCGANAASRYAALRAAAGRDRGAPASTLFAAGGYAFMAGRDGAELLFDAGPLGLWPNAAHGHCDALSVQLRVGDRWLLCDPGTGTYFGDPALRDRLRGTAAHNTVSIDGLDQADRYEVFKWVNPPAVGFDADDAVVDGPVRFVAARHDGYRRLRRPQTHRRYVLGAGDGWLIVDRVDGRAGAAVSRHFGFDPDAVVERVDDGGEGLDGLLYRARLPGLPAAWLGFADAGDRAALGDGPWSEVYGRVRPAPRLRLEVPADAPRPLVRVCWLAVADDAPAPYRYEPYARGVASYRRVCRRGERPLSQRLIVNPLRKSLPLTPGGRAAAGVAPTTRAELVWLETDADRVRTLLIYNDRDNAGDAGLIDPALTRRRVGRCVVYRRAGDAAARAYDARRTEETV